MSIADNFNRIRDNVYKAAASVGRNGDDITIIAVTKLNGTDKIAEAIDAGATHIGENRVQEYLEKRDFFVERGVTRHIIGQLQTNKVKYIIGDVEDIQSVDRLELAAEINKRAIQRGIVQKIMVEVNIGDEPQKGGVLFNDTEPLILSMTEMPGIEVTGLMCVPPFDRDSREFFVKMRTLFEKLQSIKADNVNLRELSMGMSDDYETAICEGATMIRVGTALFGARDYTKR